MRYLANVSSLKIDESRCDGCGICMTVCPHASLAVENRKAYVRDLDACMECGACARNCAAGAITVQAGVGCAYAILKGMIRGTAPDCGCGSGSSSTCS